MNAGLSTQDHIATDSAAFESIVIPPGQSYLWRLDDYPWRRSVFNYHREFELHYIRRSSGIAYVGDYIGHFEAGHLVLVGSDMPHDWVTPDIETGSIPGRDIVVQFEAERLARAAGELPELSEVEALFSRAARGIEFLGATALRAGAMLETLGTGPGLAALSRLLEVFALLARSADYRLLASQHYRNQFQRGTAAELKKLEHALLYVQRTYLGQPRLAEIAGQLGMSESAFSRFFKERTGNTFSDHVRSLRIWTARKLLSETVTPITDICFQSGFNNISNFNRTFLAETGMPPSHYRRTARQRRINADVAGTPQAV